MRKSPNAFVRNQAAEEFLANVVAAWAREFPEEAEDFRQHIKQIRETLHKPSGMTRHGRMAWMGEIPVKVWYAVEAHHYKFFDDPRNQKLAHELLMGSLPTAGKDFHFIDRRENAPPRNSTLTLPHCQE